MNLAELQHTWQRELQKYNVLHSEYLCYTKLKEAVNSEQHYSTLNHTEDSIAGLARLQTEQEEHYLQIIHELNAEIATEQSKADALRASLNTSLPKEPPQLPKGDIAALEAECADLENALVDCADAQTRLDQLAARRTSIESHRADLESLIKKLQDLQTKTDAYKTSLPTPSAEPALRELQRLKSLEKLLSSE